MKDQIMLRGDSKCTRLRSLLDRDKRYLWTSVATIFIILAAISLLVISPAMGQAVTASSTGIWTAVNGGSDVTGIGTNEVRWGQPAETYKSGLRFDGLSVSSNFGQEFCLGKLTHFNWPIYNAAAEATLKVTLDFSTPALPDASFTYNMGIDETSNSGVCGVSCAYSPCETPCPDKISWPSIPPADQTFNLGDDTYTLQILGIKDSCSGGSPLPYFITQEKKNNEGYLVGRIVLTSRPDAIDDLYTTKTNVPLTVPAPGVLGNDFEKSGLDLDVVSYTQPAHGTVTIDLETGSMTYNPNTDFCGTDTFTYNITNGQNKYDEATVTITVVCDDNNKCTIDACVDGVCTHSEVNCDDGNVCTDDNCDPATGACVHTNNAASCDDGNACTENDVCADGACTPGSAVTCNDNNICTDDSCDPDTGCVYEDNTAPCDDGNACTENDVCADGACTSGSAVTCNDNNICTDDSCDPDTGCVYAPDDTNVCSDGMPCTDDFCSDGECVSVSKNYDDGDVCNGLETCDSETGEMVPGTPLDCDDENACTIDTCDSALGCQHDKIILEANDDSYGAIYGKTLTVPVSNGVLLNDEYDGSGTLTATLVTGPSSGTLTLMADGSFTYKPKTGFLGTATFTYKVCAGDCCSEPATVTILVAKCPWLIKNELYSAICGEDKVVLASQGVLANDPGAIAVVRPDLITIDPKYGTIEVAEDGSFVYHAAENIPTGTYVSFKYNATNGVCEATYPGIAKIQISCVCK